MRIYLDANILFSAAKSAGPVRELLSILSTAGHELCADRYVIEEAIRNLALKSPESVAALDGVLELVALRPSASPTRYTASESLPEKDRPVLDAAIRNGCDVLVTGDRKHFGALFETTVQGVEVLSPAQLARKVLR